MPDTIAELYVKIGSDFTKVDGDLNRLHSTIKGFDPSIVRMESGFSKVGKALSGIGGIIATIGIAKFGMDIFSASLKMENLNKMLVANEGSQKKANEAMAKYLEMAKLPGLNITQIVQAEVQFKSLGQSVEQTDKFIKSLSNAMVLSGRGAEEFGRVSIQFQQMIGKGRLMSEDLRVIAESFPQIRKLMIDAFQTADPEKIAKMGITAADFMAKITTEMEKMPKAIGGTQNSIDNFHDSLLQFEAALGKNVLPIVGKFLDKLTDMMDSFNKLPEGTKNVVGTFVIGGAGLLGVAFALSLIVEHGGAAIGVLKGLAGAQALAGMAGGAGAAAGTAPFVSGLVNQYGRPISSSLTAGEKAVLGTTALAGYSRGSLGAVAGLGTAIPNLIVGAMTVAALYWGGKEIYKAFTRDFTPEEKAGWAKQAPAFTADAIKEIIKAEALANPAGLTLAEIVNLGIGYKGPTGMMGGIGGPGFNEQAFTLGDKIEKAGFMWEKLSQMTAKQAVEYMQYQYPGKGTFTKVPMVITGGEMQTSLTEAQKKLQDDLDKYGEGVLDAWVSFNTQNIKAYASTEAGRYKWGPRIVVPGVEEPKIPTIRPITEAGIKPFVPERGLGIAPSAYTIEATMKRMQEVQAIEDLAKKTEAFRAIESKLYYTDEERIAQLKEMGPLFTENGVAIGDYTEALEGIEKIKIEQFEAKWQISEAEMNALDRRVERERELVDYTKEKVKVQSQFWNNMKYMGLNTMEAISDKGIGQMFDKMFESSRIKEAWADYVHEAERSGKAVEMTFAQFSDDWKKQNDINMQSWKEFLQELIVEWGKMLATKLLMYGAEKLAEWAIDKATGGKAPAIGAGSLEEIGITDKNAGMTESKHWYGRGSIIADIAGLFGQNYYETHPTEYQHGGWAMKPTFAILGEREPELVIPKSKLQSGGIGGGSLNIQNINISFPDADLRYVDPNVAKRLVVNAIRSAQASGEISKAI